MHYKVQRMCRSHVARVFNLLSDSHLFILFRPEYILYSVNYTHCLDLFVQFLLPSLAVVLVALLRRHVLGHGGAGMSLEWSSFVIKAVLDGLDGKALLSLRCALSVIVCSTERDARAGNIQVRPCCSACWDP